MGWPEQPHKLRGSILTAMSPVPPSSFAQSQQSSHQMKSAIYCLKKYLSKFQINSKKKDSTVRLWQKVYLPAFALGFSLVTADHGPCAPATLECMLFHEGGTDAHASVSFSLVYFSFLCQDLPRSPSLTSH